LKRIFGAKPLRGGNETIRQGGNSPESTCRSNLQLNRGEARRLSPAPEPGLPRVGRDRAGGSLPLRLVGGRGPPRAARAGPGEEQPGCPAAFAGLRGGAGRGRGAGAQLVGPPAGDGRRPAGPGAPPGPSAQGARERLCLPGPTAGRRPAARARGVGAGNARGVVAGDAAARQGRAGNPLADGDGERQPGQLLAAAHAAGPGGHLTRR